VFEFGGFVYALRKVADEKLLQLSIATTLEDLRSNRKPPRNSFLEIARGFSTASASTISPPVLHLELRPPPEGVEIVDYH